MEREIVGWPYYDTTCTYDVYAYDAETVGDFVQEVLSQYKNEVGSFAIRNTFEHDSLEYGRGEITKHFKYDKTNNLEIDYVECNGSYGVMCYSIYIF